MFVGGTLIRRFDGFRRLCRHAAFQFGLPLSLPDGDLMLANRILAALGGPPAAPEVRGSFQGDGLSMLLLFLLTQEMECRIGLVGPSDPLLARLRSLVHLLGHAVYPTLTGQGQLAFQEVVKEMGHSGALLKPCFEYDGEGEPVAIRPAGAAGQLRLGSDAGPYTLAVLLGQGVGPMPVAARNGPLHPAVVVLGASGS